MIRQPSCNLRKQLLIDVPAAFRNEILYMPDTWDSQLTRSQPAVEVSEESFSDYNVGIYLPQKTTKSLRDNQGGPTIPGPVQRIRQPCPIAADSKARGAQLRNVKNVYRDTGSATGVSQITFSRTDYDRFPQCWFEPLNQIQRAELNSAHSCCGFNENNFHETDRKSVV